MKPSRFGFIGKLSGRMKFFLLILSIYGGIAIFNPVLVLNALVYFKGMLAKVVPILALVFVTLFLTNLFLSPAGIRKHLGKDSGLRGWFYAIIGGIVISGPPYVLYPMLGELKQHGAKTGLIATLLYNRNVKVQFLPAMVYYFGIRYTVVLSIYIILFSLLNGKLMDFFTRE